MGERHYTSTQGKEPPAWRQEIRNQAEAVKIALRIRWEETEKIPALTGLCVGVALFLLVVSHTNTLPLTGIAWPLLLFAFLLSRTWPSKYIAWGVFAIVGSYWLSVGGSVLWGVGDWQTTAMNAAWLTPVALLPFTKHTDKAMGWVNLALIANAVAVLTQGISDGGRPGGITGSPNCAAGLCLLGFVHSVSKGRGFLAILFTLALLFTGSRLGILVYSVITPVMVIKHREMWRWWVILAIVSVLAFASWHEHFQSIFKARGDGLFSRVWFDASVITNAERTFYGHFADYPGMASPIFPIYLGLGYIHTDGLHNVPLRIFFEAGILALLAWLSLTIYAIVKAPQWTGGWWMMMAIIGLSTLDYYFWQPVMWGFWWWVISVRLNPASSS